MAKVHVLGFAALILAACSGSALEEETHLEREIDLPTHGVAHTRQPLPQQEGSVTGRVFRAIVTNVVLIRSGAGATKNPTDEEGVYRFDDVEPGLYFVYAEYWVDFRGWAARCVGVAVEPGKTAEANLTITEWLGDAREGDNLSFPARLCPEAGWTD